MDPYLVTLIVAEPGRMRDSLTALLQTIPSLGTVTPLDNWEMTERVLDSITSWGLILLDASLPNDQAWQILENVSLDYPNIGTILLVENTRQQQQAKALNADEILLKGFSTTKLLTAIARLLSRQQAHPI